MKYRIEYISTFHIDVLQAVEFMEEHPKKAARIIARLDRALAGLVENPEMYPVYDDFPKFRKIVIEDYLVFYAVIKPIGVVEIHRLIYARMDIPKRLK